MRRPGRQASTQPWRPTLTAAAATNARSAARWIAPRSARARLRASTIWQNFRRTRGNTKRWASASKCSCPSQRATASAPHRDAARHRDLAKARTRCLHADQGRLRSKSMATERDPGLDCDKVGLGGGSMAEMVRFKPLETTSAAATHRRATVSPVPRARYCDGGHRRRPHRTASRRLESVLDQQTAEPLRRLSQQGQKVP
jgi:hypothetical protein